MHELRLKKKEAGPDWYYFLAEFTLLQHVSDLTGFIWQSSEAGGEWKMKWEESRSHRATLSAEVAAWASASEGAAGC